MLYYYLVVVLVVLCIFNLQFLKSNRVEKKIVTNHYYNLDTRVMRTWGDWANFFFMF